MILRLSSKLCALRLVAALAMVAASLEGCASTLRGGQIANEACRTWAGLFLYRSEPSPVDEVVFIGLLAGIDANGNVRQSQFREDSVSLAGLEAGLKFFDVPWLEGMPAFLFTQSKPGRGGLFQFSLSRIGDPRCAAWEEGEKVRRGLGPMPQRAFPPEGTCVAMERIGDLSLMAKKRVFFFDGETLTIPDEAKLGVGRGRRRLWDRELGTLAESRTVTVNGFYGDVDYKTCGGPKRDFDADVPRMFALLRPGSRKD